MTINKLIQALILPALFVGSSGAFGADISASDASFLKKAAQSGHYEVQGSNLALKKSKNAEIQKFAKQMVQDHTKAAQELKTLAQKKNVELPAEPNFMQKGSLMLLDTYDTKNFDEEYAENVGVDGHEQTVELFEDAAEDAEDAEVKQFAVKTLPTLKHHHEMAKKLDEMVD